MYLNDNEVAFTSLCLGEKYRDVIATQIQSIIKFTNYNHYIVTDDPDFFGNYYGPRVHYIKFDESLTDLPLMTKQNIFNYNLKMVPIKWTIENVRPTICVFMDSDTFLFGFNRMFYRTFMPEDTGIWARQRNQLNDSASHKIVLDKCELMGIDITNIETKLPIENVMFFKTGGNKLTMFLNEWYNYAKLSYEVGARGDFEAVEMALAIHKSGVDYRHIGATNPAVDDFVTLHHNRLHRPFII